MTVDVRLLGPSDSFRFATAAEGVFDNAIDPEWAAEFLADPRHHMAVAIDAGVIVGFASGVHYLHPDKAPELFVNEVAVAPTHQRRGLGRRVLQRLLDHARTLGCACAWVLTDEDNAAARALYDGLGGGLMEGRTIGFEFVLD
jgi:ribosomal protein S18 acetylase RimI-like enzyme